MFGSHPRFAMSTALPEAFGVTPNGRRRVPCSPRIAGAGSATAYPLLPEFAGLRVARPALEETRYFPRVVIGRPASGRRAGPAGGEMRDATRAPCLDLHSSSRGHRAESRPRRRDILSPAEVGLAQG